MISETLVQAFLIEFLDERVYHVQYVWPAVQCPQISTLLPLISSGMKSMYGNSVHFPVFFCALNSHVRGYKTS